MRNALLLAALLLTAVPGQGKPPKPVPGGVHQKEGVEGKTGEWLFNGKYRMRLDSVAPLTPEELAADPGLTPSDENHQLLAVRFTLKNGQKLQDSDTIDVTLADADDITISSVPYLVVPNPTPPTVQGGAWKERAVIDVPKDFTPTRIVVTFPTAAKYKAFRVQLGE